MKNQMALGVLTSVLFSSAFVLAQEQKAQSAQTQKQEKVDFSDSGIASDIGNELFYDRYFDPRQVKYNVRNGVVTLEGTVQDLRSKERAVEIVEGIRGVRSVVDRLNLQASKRDDQAIQADVTSAFILDAATEAFQVKPTVANGVVTLTGTVDSWPEKATAASVAKGVKGVIDVRNDIQVKQPKDRPSAEVASDIRARLRRDPWINHPVNVSVDGSRAKLTGIVGSLLEKRRAYQAAWISGINEVDFSGLTVDPALGKPPQQGPTQLSKAEVEDAIQDALAWDPRVKSFNVMATFANGVATLTGKVDNLKAKRAAEADALNTEGVFSVVNKLQVTTPQERTDARIATDVRKLLLMDPLVDKYQITTAVNKGVVTLTGTVNTLFEKYYAEDDASRIRGVKEVDNKLAVKVQPAPIARTDQEIQQALSRSLRANPLLEKEDKVSFTVKDKTVTLNGSVDTFAESLSAVDAAFDSGATKVENRISGPDAKVLAITYTYPPREYYGAYWVDELPWDSGSNGSVSGTTRSNESK